MRAPGGRAEAVLIETNGGATTSFGYLVFIVAPGASVPRAGRGVGGEAASLYGAARSDSASGANLRWLGRDTLAVEYQQASMDSLVTPAVPLPDGTVHVVLRPGVTDPTAPAGGMQYNRVKRAPLRP